MEAHVKRPGTPAESRGRNGVNLMVGRMDSNQTEERPIGCIWGINARKG